MKALLQWIREEPAMVVSLALTGLNLFTNLSDGQADAVRNIVESAIILIGGGAVRASVTPTAKRSGPQP